MNNAEIREQLDQIESIIQYATGNSSLSDLESPDMAIQALREASNKLKQDQEGVNRPKAQIVLTHKNGVDEWFVLGENDSMPMNSSTNHDHHYQGSGLIVIKKNGMKSQHETYVNDRGMWLYLERMVRLGQRYMDENPDFNVYDFDDKLREEYEKREPIKSIHDER